jgi:hypothetical protein
MESGGWCEEDVLRKRMWEEGRWWERYLYPLREENWDFG